MNGETNKLLLQISRSLDVIVKALVLIFWLLLAAAVYGLEKIEHFSSGSWWLIPIVFLVWLLAVLVFFVHDGRQLRKVSKKLHSNDLD